MLFPPVLFCALRDFLMQAAAVAAVLDGQLLFAAAMYTLAFNHKHMLLYFAPAFFSTLLGASFSPPKNHGAITPRKVSQEPQRLWWVGIGKVLQLGLVVGLTCAIVWAPFLSSSSNMMQAWSPLCCSIAISAFNVHLVLIAFPHRSILNE
jgi:hypothetical protein